MDANTAPTLPGVAAMITIGAPAPDFTARTTLGQRSLADYRGRWLIFFSHPADFTPVCTSEFVTFSKLFPAFQQLNCDLLALSIDSLSSHIAWVRSIKDRFGVSVTFPLIEDPSMSIARAYGMLRPDALDSSTVRASYVIDPDGIIRAISWYPMSVGRSVAEILRLILALQTSDAEAVSTPEGWQLGDPVIDAAPLSLEDVLNHQPSATAPDWYFQTRDKSAK
ncbi:MAG: peroxiredoxin [Hyphomicrobiales bacterium]|nr:peroxiredoxin [Hyphomicrobiales bacterium]